MTAKQMWLNLPVRDVAVAKLFYEKMGFAVNTAYGNNLDSASFFVSEQKVVMMLFGVETFAGFINSSAADLSFGSEVLFNLSADSKQEVDAMVQRVIDAGGQVFSAPHQVQGWMYGMGFADPDGHKWHLLFMDFAQLPKA